MNFNHDLAAQTKLWLGRLLLALLIFIPRLPGLNLFLTADEPLFLEHAQAFAAGMASGDFKQTLGIGYPGVTIAAWTAPVAALAQTELDAYTAGRAAVALLTGFLIVLIYGLARRLVGRGPALIGTVLLALDPYTLAYSRLYHLEAPLALLMTLAGLAALLWLAKEQARWLIWAGLFTGLALLTKSTALLLGPMLGLMVLGWGWASGRWRSQSWRLALFKGGLVLTISSVVIFWALWPAMWIDPVGALSLTFGKLFTDQEAGAGNLGMFWFGRFVEDPGPLFYPVAFILKSTPWLLAGLLLSLILHLLPFLFPTSPSESFNDSRDFSPAGRNDRLYKFFQWATLRFTFYALRFTLPALSLWLFTLTYLILMTLASKKSIRYLLPAFPTFYLLAGLAFYQLGQFLRNRPFRLFPISLSPHLPISPSPLLLLVLLVTFTLLYQPYYFSYYNPLVLGWRWAPHALLVGWGEGLDEAARYLNRQPAQRVAAWYEWLFPLFYTQGEVLPVTPQENLITADRTVLYINQVQRDIPNPNVIHYFRTRRRPEHTARLAGIDYAWVYSGPIAGVQKSANPQFALQGEFGGEMRLLGYDLQPQPVAGGDSLIVTFYWQVLQPPAANRFVYLRLLDAKGQIWARADGPPVMGLWPVGRWQPGMIIEDAQALPVPAGTPAGAYRLEAGLYEPDSGQSLAAGGQPIGQGGGLLLGEVAVAWRSLPQAELDLLQPVDLALSGNVHLIGYSEVVATATTGDVIPVELVWREAGSIWPWRQAVERSVIFEWSREGQLQAEQLEPLPLPVEQWQRGAVVRSLYSLITPPVLETGNYELQVKLHTGTEPVGRPILLGQVAVTAPAHQFTLPAGAMTPADHEVQLDQKIALAGYELEQAGQTLKLTLYWQTHSPVTKPYKVFAQLLDRENRLVAQSDSFPAAGQRPTTGWLPAEVIEDAHTLPLPADLPSASQSYRLIAGLYDPLNGQRLPGFNPAGEMAGDAILVAEVTLP